MLSGERRMRIFMEREGSLEQRLQGADRGYQLHQIQAQIFKKITKILLIQSTFIFLKVRKVNIVWIESGGVSG